MLLIYRLVPIAFVMHFVDDVDEPFNLKEPARLKEYPYVVAVYLSHSGKLCSGSILAPSWVLTAAHCIDVIALFFPAIIRVFAGNINSTALLEGWDNSISFSSQKTNVLQVVFHPGFKYDAALLRLMSEFQFNEYVQPIPIAAKPFPSRSEICTAVGYGRNYALGGPGVMHWVDLVVVDIDKCKSQFLYKNITLYIDSMVCAKGVKGRGMCNGDSGSPLICQGKHTGVLSAGILESGWRRPNKLTDCGALDMVSVYMFTGTLAPWISEIIPEIAKAETLDSRYVTVIPRSAAIRPGKETFGLLIVLMYSVAMLFNTSN